MWHLRLCFNDLGFHFLCIRPHFLLLRHSHGPAFFCLSLCDAFIRFRLIGQQFRTDIASDIDISNINRQNFKCRSGIQPFAKYRF